MKNTAKLLALGTVAVATLGIGFASTGPTPSQGYTSTTAATLANHPGKLLASNCFQCHGTNGRGGQFETLGGSSEIYQELKEEQTSSGIMSVHVRAYTDAELKLIADFFAKA